jgi:hypothetical protein
VTAITASLVFAMAKCSICRGRGRNLQRRDRKLARSSSEKALGCPLSAKGGHRETMAYLAAVAAFSINAATSRGCKRKMAWGPASSIDWD